MLRPLSVVAFALLCTLAGFCLGCLDQGPSQADEARFGRVTLFFDRALPTASDPGREWRVDELAELRRAVRLASRAGPAYVETDATATYSVRPFDSGAGCVRGAGRLIPSGHQIELDVACTGAGDGLATALAHELLHAYLVERFGFAGHICARPDARPDCHPTIVAAAALLQPGVSTGVDGLAGETLSVAFPEPAQADLDLFALCLRQGRCR